MSAGELTSAQVQELHRILELERARYAELFELSPIGYVVTDLDGVVREANRAAAELLAAEPGLLAGKPLAVFVPLEDRAAFRRRLLDAGRRPGTHRWQAELHARDGARVVAEVIVGPALVDGELGGLRWVMQDVSERFAHELRERRLESEYETRLIERTAGLDDQRALLTAVIENIPAGLVVVDRLGAPLLANREALRILRLDSFEDLSVEDWREAETFSLDGRRISPEEQPMARTLATGEIVTSEKHEVVLDGRHVIIETSTSPIVTSAGERTGGLAILRDVTTQERTERAERDFVTNAAHELQSPLAAIVSAIEVLQSGAKDGPQRDVFLAHIEREADRLARLVRALLILARTQTGLEAPRDELVGLCALLEDVGTGLHLSSSVELVVDCPEDLAVLTNRELVEQAIVNLAENAAKHTKTGRIALSAREVEGGLVELSVADTGVGIAAPERPRIFERFYRADPNGSAGFGLGLAIVRAVADALHGEIELDSTVDSGTVVRLRIPNAATLVNQ